MNWRFLASGIAVLMLLGLAGYSRIQNPERPSVISKLVPGTEEVVKSSAIRLRPGDTGLVAAGREIYAKACASCHGKNLEGQPKWKQRKPNGRLPAPPHDPSGHIWHHPDGQLFALTKLGPARIVGDGY